jgi:integrase
MPFHPATLSFLPSKGKYYVYVTIPKDLQAQFGRTQIKRSTGTSDRKEALRRLHSLEQEIYKRFNPIKDKVEFFAGALTGLDREGAWTKQELDDPQKLRQIIASLLKDAQTEAQRPRLPWDQEDGESGWLKDFATDTAVPALTKMHSDTFANGDPDALTFADLRASYFEGPLRIAASTITSSKLATKDFSDFIGPKIAKGIKTPDIVQYCRYLHSKGIANNSVRTRISKVSAVFTAARELGLLEYNPCKGIKLKDYGEKHEKYKPLSLEEIAALFCLDIPPQERLILQLLMSSGARRDEIATLIWSDITTETGVLILDLTKRPEIRKNEGSCRKIPIHPKVTLPPRGEPDERLFDYNLMENGKTSNASATLMRYVRQVTDDPLKVVHSLRGSFKDAMRNLGVSKELHDYITGHGAGDVSDEYGEGMSIKVRYEAISKLPVPW